jgi:hypothetical protein
MLNHAFVEGYIATTWRYHNDLMLKVAVYRDPDNPEPVLTVGGKQLPDYVVARIPNAVQKGIDFAEKQQVRIEGFMKSHDIEETLEDFLARSNYKNPNIPRVEVVGGSAKEIIGKRSNVELLVTKYDLVFARKEKSEQNTEPARKPDLKSAKSNVSAETGTKKK